MRPTRTAEDPLEALARLEGIARQAIRSIADGRSPTGRTALTRIAEDAADIRRHHLEDAAALTAAQEDPSG